MPIDYKGAAVPTCYATCSIGHDDPGHTLPRKLEAIAAAGFDAVELSMPDVVAHGATLRGGGQAAPAEDDYEGLAEAAADAARLARGAGLGILMMQPFAHLEGWPRGGAARREAFARAEGWARVMRAAGTDMLQVGSSDADAAEATAADPGELAADLAELADRLKPLGMRVAYENWCWATRAPGWREVWEVVRRAGRDNLGLCLDTFQSAGGEWGDPTTESGMVEEEQEQGEGGGGGEGAPPAVTEAQVRERWARSLRDLAREVPADKIYLLQVSDAYRLRGEERLARETREGLRPRARWSHDHRPLPYDGGYLPVAEFTAAVLATGFRGWLSVEVFDGRARDKFAGDMAAQGRRGMEALGRLLEEAGGLSVA